MRIPKIHELKVWMNFYPNLEDESKTFELRKNDRDFQKKKKRLSQSKTIRPNKRKRIADR